MAFIISAPNSISFGVKLSGIVAILHNRLGVGFRVADPNNLHLSLVRCETEMDLLMAWLVLQQLHFGNGHQFSNIDLTISISVKHVKGILDSFLSDVVIGFHEFEVIYKLVESGSAAVVKIIRVSEESLKVVDGHLGAGGGREQEKNE